MNLLSVNIKVNNQDKENDRLAEIEQKMSRLVLNQNLEAIEENSEQSENISYVSNSHNDVSFDELMTI